MNTIVVTRHPALVEYLLEQGIIEDGAEVISHVDRDEQVAGKRVIGIIPFRLASLAKSVIVVDLDVPADKRGVELTLDDVRAFARGVEEYSVVRVEHNEPAKSGTVATFDVRADLTALKQAELDLLARTNCEIIGVSDSGGSCTIDVFCPTATDVYKARIIVGRAFGIVPPDHALRFYVADLRVTLYEDAEGNRWRYAHNCVENTGVWWARGY